MKLRAVTLNNRKKRLELETRSRQVYPFPFAKMDPGPTSDDRIAEVFVDPELGREAATYVLESGAEGAVHIEHALEYNQDPRYLSDLLAHKLTVEARRRMEGSALSRREVARRLGTSVPQVYRLVDPARPRKSLNQLVALLHVLDCDVELVLRDRDAA